MDKIISSVSVNINGRIFPAMNVNPSEETYRSRVQLMGAAGYIENEVEHGLELTFSESKVAAFTPEIRNMTNGRISIIYDDGSQQMYSGCVVLGRSKSGYSPNEGATITYTVAAREVVDS